MANPVDYLADLAQDALCGWPDNRTLTIVCHGHSVPAGYFATPHVDTFSAYPHLWHQRLKERFPSAVFNVITTAVGGEDAESGAARFAADVLSLRPDLVTIDYGLNDRRLGLPRAQAAWRAMLDQGRAARVKLLVLTPTWDVEEAAAGTGHSALATHAQMIRDLAGEADVAVADAYAAFARYVARGHPVTDLLVWPNHPNRRGHDLVAAELMRWVPVVVPAPGAPAWGRARPPA